MRSRRELFSIFHFPWPGVRDADARRHSTHFAAAQIQRRNRLNRGPSLGQALLYYSSEP